MTTPLKAAFFAPASYSFDLHELAGELVKDFLPLAQRNKTFFVNDIPRDLYLGTDPEMIATVLADLLRAMATNAKDSCIHLSAKMYSDVVLIHVKDCSTFNSYALETGLQRMQPVVERLGGFLNITSLRKKVTTVAFCFPNIPLAA